MFRPFRYLQTKDSVHEALCGRFIMSYLVNSFWFSIIWHLWPVLNLWFYEESPKIISQKNCILFCMLKFWNGSTNVLVIYICHLIWTLDNVNTRTALELLRELIGEVNIYMASARSTDRTPNRMILKNIATYITSLFKVSVRGTYTTSLF